VLVDLRRTDYEVWRLSSILWNTRH